MLLRLLFLATGVAGFALMIAFGPQIAIFTSIGVLFTNFATCCFQYEDANLRAGQRMKVRMSQLQVNSDEYQRLSSAKIKPTDADRQHPMNVITMVNLATGIACIGFFVWGLLLWVL